MPKFQVIDRVACWVNFRFEVEADCEEEAKQIYLYHDGSNTEVVLIEEEISDNVEGMDNSLEVIPMEQ